MEKYLYIIFIVYLLSVLIYSLFINKYIPRYIIPILLGSIVAVLIIYYLFMYDLSFLILFIFLLSLTFIIIGYREGDNQLAIFGYTTLLIAMSYLYIYNYRRISNLKKFRVILKNNSILSNQDSDVINQLENCESENRNIKSKLTDVEDELNQTKFELETLLNIADKNVGPKKRKRIG